MKRARSSAGQSARFTSVRSMVRVHSRPHPKDTVSWTRQSTGLLLLTEQRGGGYTVFVLLECTRLLRKYKILFDLEGVFKKTGWNVLDGAQSTPDCPFSAIITAKVLFTIPYSTGRELR